ncbi:23S rRNA (guanosine(2251)-2'-O)-methyltransferase RlmB [Candidatus Nomurabacteria bacterium]|nr:23S rRNA (guanosine(2251)-2'-O)-methyltransferase RlmB [Candidatus Nomurabacteria bacterium]
MESDQNSVYIYGRKPVLEYVQKSEKSSIKEVFVYKDQNDSSVKDLIDLLKTRKIKVNFVKKEDIIRRVGDVNHQGVAALVDFNFTPLSFWLKEKLSEKSTVLVFDHITDTGNAGAMIRSARAFGVDTIILPLRNQAPIDGKMMKSSAGNLADLNIIVVSNINDTLEKLKKAGFWVYGLDMDGKKNITEEDFSEKVALVVGSEGEGIRPKTKELCDIMLSIPMQKGIESLNASVAAAIVMYEIYKKNS